MTPTLLPRFYWLCFFSTQILVVTGVSAQYGQPIDSLIQVSASMPNDTFKSNALINITNQLYRKGEFEASRNFAAEALRIAEPLGHKRVQALAHNFTGISYRNQGFPDEAIIHYQKAFRIWQEMGDRRNMAGYHMNIGIIHSQQGQLTKALEDFAAAAAVFKELNYQQGLGHTFLNMGITHKNLGNYAMALEYYSKALQHQEDCDEQMSMGRTYYAIGMVHEIQGNYTAAIAQVIKAMEIYETLENQDGICSALQALGNINHYIKDTETALDYYTKALPIAEKIGNALTVAGIQSNIGNVYVTRHEPEKALPYYFFAQEIYETYDDQAGLGHINNNIGAIYLQTGEYRKAFQHFSDALAIALTDGDPESLTTSYLNLGKANIYLSEYESARAAFDSTLSLARRYNFRDILPDVYLSLVTLDSLTGQHQLGLVHLKNYMQTKDSVFNAEKSRIITELQTQYETEKKNKAILALESQKTLHALQLKVQEESLMRIRLEKDKVYADNKFNQQQIALLDNEKKLQQLALDKNETALREQQALTTIDKAKLTVLSQEAEIQQLRLRRQTVIKNYLIGGVIAALVLGLFIYNNHITRQQLKLQTLRNKIASDLHDDVGSTLSSISIFSEMAQKQSTEVIPMLNTIGESSRKMLDAMADIVWTINPENDQFENILLRMRSFAYTLLGAKKIDFEFEAEDELAAIKLPMDVRKNLYLIFKEAANNMAKYSDASLALFSLKEEKRELVMLIQDNGKGFDTSLASTGNGLKNMQRRAKEIGAKLMIDSTVGKGTSIELRIAV